jgi:hypothetical protein
MLNFVNINEEIAFQNRTGISDASFGLQVALDANPLDFQYSASEAVTSFSAIRKDITGAVVETISLSTSLITYDAINSLHICDGQTPYGTPLECGIYYFLVNNKFQSEDFDLNVVVTEGTLDADSVIAISGLSFFNDLKDIPGYNKKGKPYIVFGSEMGTNTRPLDFQYKAAEAVTDFDIIKIDTKKDTCSTSALNTSLITYDAVNGVHICDGQTIYDNYHKYGLYYFSVNDKFISETFIIQELTCAYVDNIRSGNLISCRTGIVLFDTLITGSETSLTVEFTYTFSCDIDTFTSVESLTTTSQQVKIEFAIPAGVYGNCTLTISNDLCGDTYTHSFVIIEGNSGCLELISGGTLELIGGGCLELISGCPSEGIGVDIIEDTLIVY